MKQIGFIVGTGRCGTTILARVLNSHSKICVPHELQIICGIGNGDRLYEKYLSGEAASYGADDFIALIRDRCPYYFERYFDYITHFKKLQYPQRDLRTLLKELFDHICYANKKEIFLEQTPWYGQRLDVLKQLFPEMTVVHIVRDGRDVAISFSRTPWWSKDIGANLLQWEKEVNVIHDFKKKNPENFAEIRYEDLVLNPEALLTKVLNPLGLTFENKMLDPEQLVDYSSMFRSVANEYRSQKNKDWEQIMESVFFTRSISSWKRYKGYNFEKLPEKVKATLRMFHYET